jgi:hypothetical protein
MKIKRGDWLFLLLGALVLTIFFLISGPEKTKKVPYDDRHRVFYDIVNKSGGRMEAEKGCPACHNEKGGVPFPARHPVKPPGGTMRCLFCHKLKKG